MPDGSPIDQWWKSHRPAPVSTPTKDRVCARSDTGRAYCGRRSGALVDDWPSTTCADCLAAGRADGWID